MCLLVKVAPNTKFPFPWFKDCFSSNPDGLGIAYVKDGQVVSAKHLPTDPADAFIWWGRNAPKDTPYAMHWRMRTHGAVDVERVHPYPVTDNIMLMHNGILSIEGDTTVESDTQIYARTYGRALSASLHEPLVQKLIGKQIGGTNRFIFIHAEHGLIVVNEDTGVTTERFPGCWFSNTYAWTPYQWGVDTYAGRYSGFGGRGIPTWARWEEDGGSDDRGNLFPFPRATPTVSLDNRLEWDEPESEEPVGSAADATGLTAEQELAVVVEGMFRHARSICAFDAPAQRFLNYFDNEDEFMAALKSAYDGDFEDALQQCVLTLQYIEAAQCDFDDVLTWYTETTDDLEGLEVAEGGESNNEGYSG